MADMALYKPNSFELGSTSVPFRNMRLVNENQEEQVTSDGALYPELVQVLQKRPILMATILDPGLVTDFQAVGAGETYTSLLATWRAIAQEGGPSGAYVSALMALGALYPMSLSSPFESIATLEVACRARYNSGTAVAIGTTSGTRPQATKAYRASSIVIGSDTVLKINSVSVNWNYGIVQEEMLEPDHYGYEAINISGSAVLSDLSLVSEARLEDRTTEAVTITLTDLNNGSNTVQYSLGNCSINIVIQGEKATVNFQKLVA